MRSWASAASFPEAFAKASLAAGDRLPREGTVFISVADAEKDAVILMALMLSTLGFRILATEGTHRALTLNGIDSESVLKHTVGLEMRVGPRGGRRRGRRPRAAAPGAAPITTIVDLIEAGEIDLVINIPRGRGARSDGYEIRRAALRQGVPTMTNAAAAHAAVQAIAKRSEEPRRVRDLPSGSAQPPGGLGRRHRVGSAPRRRCGRERDAADVCGRDASARTGGGRVLGRVAGRAARGSLVWLTVEVPGWPGARPGQFALLQAEPSRCFLARALSISDEDEGEVSFLIDPIGEGTRELCGLSLRRRRLGAWDPWAMGSPWKR